MKGQDVIADWLDFIQLNKNEDHLVSVLDISESSSTSGDRVRSDLLSRLSIGANGDRSAVRLRKAN